MEDLRKCKFCGEQLKVAYRYTLKAKITPEAETTMFEVFPLCENCFKIVKSILEDLLKQLGKFSKKMMGIMNLKM